MYFYLLVEGQVEELTEATKMNKVLSRNLLFPFSDLLSSALNCTSWVVPINLLFFLKIFVFCLMFFWTLRQLRRIEIVYLHLSSFSSMTSDRSHDKIRKRVSVLSCFVACHFYQLKMLHTAWEIHYFCTDLLCH